MGKSIYFNAPKQNTVQCLASFLIVTSEKLYMKSRAHISSHPLHPILVGFPIAFYTGTFLFDVLAGVLHNYEYALVAQYMHIGGVLTAVAAAVPGIIDYIYTVPPKSSGKKRAAKHGILNSIALLLFGTALLLKYLHAASPFIVIGLEGLALGTTMFAGWMGGTLVHRNLIGVDMRYAGAGKWKEITVQASHGLVEAAEEDELQLNQMKLVRTPLKRIVLGKSEDGWVAFDDHCTHRGGSLAGGAMICGTVQCPWHGGQFNVKTGKVVCGPPTQPITTYLVTVSNGKVYINL